MTDRFKNVYEDVEKHGQRVMLEVCLLAIFRVSRGLYEDAKEEVFRKHQIKVTKVVEKEYIDGKGRPIRPIFKDGKMVVEELI